MVDDRPVALGRAWHGEHAHLEQLCSELLIWFREGSREELRSAWRSLEDSLLAHFRSEEREILPLFAEVEPAEAQGLRAEHEALRRQLAELGVGIDLQLVPLELARSFIAGLRAHGLREDKIFHRWLDRQPVEPKLAEAVHGAYARLVRSRQSVPPLARFCRKQVATVHGDATIAAAARLMRDRHVGALVVVGDDGMPAGIVTDRDLVCRVLADAREASTPVAEVMSRGLVKVEAREGLDQVAFAMQQNGVRRIPIVDGEGRLAGLVTFDDLVVLFSAELGETVAAVRHNRGP